MKTIFKTHRSLNECLIGFRIDGAGSVFDLFPGAFHILEHILSQKIEAALRGGRIDAFTFREYQSFHIAIPTESLPATHDLFFEKLEEVKNGDWSEDEVDRAKRMIRHERQIHTRNPHEQLMEALDAAVLCHEYARPTSSIDVSGDIESLKRLASNVFVERSISIVCLAPPGTRNIFASTQSSERRHPAILYPSCPRHTASITVEGKQKDEAYIRFDFPGFGLDSEFAPYNAIAASLLSGPVGMVSRQLGEVGETLSYDLFSGSSQFANFGQIYFGAACLSEDLDQVHKIVLDRVEQLTTAGIDQETWERLYNLTKQDVVILKNNPYDLFDFLLTELHPKATGIVSIDSLLKPWEQTIEKAEKALRIIFDPKTISIGKMKTRT